MRVYNNLAKKNIIRLKGLCVLFFLLILQLGVIVFEPKLIVDRFEIVKQMEFPEELIADNGGIADKLSCIKVSGLSVDQLSRLNSQWQVNNKREIKIAGYMNNLISQKTYKVNNYEILKVLDKKDDNLTVITRDKLPEEKNELVELTLFELELSNIRSSELLTFISEQSIGVSLTACKEN